MIHLISTFMPYAIYQNVWTAIVIATYGRRENGLASTAKRPNLITAILMAGH